MKEIEEIKQIRVKNNDLWMEIFEVALVSNPYRTKEIIKELFENDKKINDALKKLIGQNLV